MDHKVQLLFSVQLLSQFNFYSQTINTSNKSIPLNCLHGQQIDVLNKFSSQPSLLSLVDKMKKRDETPLQRNHSLKNNELSIETQKNRKETKGVNRDDKDTLANIGKDINNCLLQGFKQISDDITKAMLEPPREIEKKNDDQSDINNAVKLLIQRVNKLEHEQKEAKETIRILNDELATIISDRKKQGKQTSNNHTNQRSKPATKYNPAFPVDSKGNSLNIEDKHVDPQPLDYAKVAAAHIKKPPRPTLSEPTNILLKEALTSEPIITEEVINSNSITANEKRAKIQELLFESKKYIGISPIKPDSIEKTLITMEKKGYFDQNMDYATKKASTIKSMVKAWTLKNLKMTDTEWNEIQLQEIRQVSTTSDIIFLKFSSPEQTSKITAKARNLPADSNPDSPRLVTYVLQQGSSRYKGFQQLAKKLRLLSPEPIKTNIRCGKFDFLLRIQPKSESKPWGSIAPIIIEQNLPDFNVGILKDKDESLDIETIANDIINQNKRQNSHSREPNSKNAKLDNIDNIPSNPEAFLASTPLNQEVLEDAISMSNRYSILHKDLMLSSSSDNQSSSSDENPQNQVNDMDTYAGKMLTGKMLTGKMLTGRKP